MQPPGPGDQKIALPDVKYVVAVASGKGGVGKSTVAVNLALALHGRGHEVGLLDADIYGPSVPRMMGVVGTAGPTAMSFPLERFGIKLMSMGFLVPPTQAVVWRGPMVHRAITDFLTNPAIRWGTLDFLLIDLPPGTGDAQLSLSQTAPLSGALIVTMPQEVSLTVAHRGLEMFNQVRVPVLGIVENMSFFVGDDGKRYEIFRGGGGRKLAEETGVPFLGEIPIDPHVAECGDEGVPVVDRYPSSAVAQAYQNLAGALIQQLDKGAQEPALPELKL